jgi:hypothetical protein
VSCAANHGRCDLLSGRCECLAAGTYGEFCELDGASQGRIAAGLFIPAFSLLLCGTFFVARRSLEDSWKHWKKARDEYVSDSLRLNVANALVIVGMIVETIQLCGICFQRAVTWHASSANSVRGLALPLLFQVDNHVAFLWLSVLSFVLAILFLLCVLPFISFGSSKGQPAAYEWFRVNDWRRIFVMPAPTIITIVNLAWLPITGMLFRGLNCTYRDVGVAPYVTADPIVQCWSSQHAMFVCFSFVGLGIFVPTMVSIRPRLQDVSPQLQILFSPHFLVWLLTTELIQTATATFFGDSSEYALVNLIVVLICMLFLVLYIYFVEDGICVQASVGRWRMVSFLVVLWTSVLAVSAVARPDSQLIFIIWATGVALFVVTTVLVQAGLINTPAVAASRIAAALNQGLNLPKHPDDLDQASSSYHQIPADSLGSKNIWKAVTQEDGKTFYLNLQTGVTTWKAPAGADIQMVVAPRPEE